MRSVGLIKTAYWNIISQKTSPHITSFILSCNDLNCEADIIKSLSQEKQTFNSAIHIRFSIYLCLHYCPFLCQLERETKRNTEQNKSINRLKIAQTFIYAYKRLLLSTGENVHSVQRSQTVLMLMWQNSLTFPTPCLQYTNVRHMGCECILKCNDFNCFSCNAPRFTWSHF